MSATQSRLGQSIGAIHRPTDEEIAVAITRSVCGPGGATKDVSSYIDKLPELAGRPVVLDAAIRAALGSPHCTPSIQRERAERLKKRFPDHSTEIERTLWLNRMFDRPGPRCEEDTDEQPPVPDALGPRLPDGSSRYTLIEPIGSGANGSVYLAEDRLLSSEGVSARVAVKLLNNAGGGLGDRATAEARRMRLVEHTNVVRVSDVGKTPDGRAYIVQEYVEGQNLGEWLEAAGGTRRIGEIVRMLAAVADGVQAIHAAGLVHHDLKPQNILVGSDGSVRVADFGSASWNGVDGEKAGRASPGPGTLAFMAPELLRLLEVAPMPCSDVFSLGAMLHWALTRRPVAGEDSASAIAALADRDGEFTELDAGLRRAGIGRDLRLIIQRAVSTRFESRHPSAGAFAHDLRERLAHRPIGWTKPGVPHRAGLLLRRRPFALAACAMVLVSLGFAGFAARSAQAQSIAARESEHAAELERQKLETEIAWKKKAGRSLRRLLTSFGAAKQQGLEAEVLTSLWILEWSHGPMLLNNPDTLHEIWQTRIGVLERRRDALLSAGGGGGEGEAVEARFMEPSLALWYLRDDRPLEAFEMLSDSLPAWERLCGEGDPWLEQVRVLRAVSLVRLILSGADGTEVSRSEELNSAVGVLRGYVDSATSPHGKPVLVLARETLALVSR